MNSMYNSIVDNLCYNRKKLKGIDKLVNINNDNTLIQIVGDSDTGKSVLALDLVKKNKDKTFIYVDTFYNVKNAPDNCIMLFTNRFKIIKYMLNVIEKDVCDFLILDAYNNLYDEDNDTWEDDTFINMTRMLKEIINLCYSRNICIILINSINGLDKPFNFNNFLKLNSQYILQTIRYDYCNKIIYIKPVKALVTTKEYKYSLKQ